jgi:hypothetical protein
MSWNAAEHLLMAILAIISASCLVVFLFWALEAWYGVRYAPREDMYSCDKHGLVPKSMCIVFEEKTDENAEQQYQCPFCFEAAFKLADKKFKETERTRAE